MNEVKNPRVISKAKMISMYTQALYMSETEVLYTNATKNRFSKIFGIVIKNMNVLNSARHLLSWEMMYHGIFF